MGFAMTIYPPTCPYCNAPAIYAFYPGSFVKPYPYHRDYGPVWMCPQDSAWVGCHPDGRPLGRLADKALRDAKIEAHRAFDILCENWPLAYPEHVREDGQEPVDPKVFKKVRGAMKSRAYRWLAEQLDIPVAECHVGMFTSELCYRTVDVIDKQRPTSATIRAWAKAKHVAQ